MGLLQVSCAVLECGSGARNRAALDVGIYVGVQHMEYGHLGAPHLAAISPFSATGSPFSVAAGRLAFMYSYQGPAVGPHPLLGMLS